MEREVKGSVQILTCLFLDTPFLFCLHPEVVLICCVLYRCWCWLSLCTWFYLFRSWVDDSTTPPFPAQLHVHLFLLSFFFFFLICIYDRTFYLSEAMIIPGCCSQSLLCSHWNSWRLPGDVLHIPWAQDLLLVSFCGCCEVQLVLYVSPSGARVCRTWLENPLQTVCEEEEESFPSINLFVFCVVSFSVSLTMTLLFRDYLNSCLFSWSLSSMLLY